MAEKIDYKALKAGGFMSQKQKGYGSLRLAVVGGNLDASAIKTVAEVAEKYGHGYVHMTSRQGIEIPFIHVNDLEKVKEELKEGGVYTGVCGPRVRTITACQGSEICPSGCIDTYTLAQELNDRYFGRELPHKFKFGVTGCQNNCLKAEENDVGVKGGMTVEYKEDACISCGVCVKACREGALTMKDGKVAVKGWLETSSKYGLEFLRELEDMGVGAAIVTDISRDGAMRGVNLELYRTIAGCCSMDITASGGVSTLDDVRALRETGVYGAIIGKAYYTGAVRLEDALEVCR